MTLKIPKSLDDLSLLLVMQDPRDTQGFSMLMDLVRSLKNEASSDPQGNPLAQACDSLLTSAATLRGEELLDKLTAFATSAQAFITDPTRGMPISYESASLDGWGTDISSALDPDLAIECIEKHLSGMEDLESHLLRLVSSTSAPSAELLAESKAFVRGYLHTLKGDCGSVGFHGVEQATHHMEDLMTGAELQTMVEPLLAFREWVIETFKAFHSGNGPRQSAADFRVFISTKTGVGAPEASVDTEEVSQTSSTGPADTAAEEYSLEGESDILVEFIVEAEDHLNALEEKLLDSNTVAIAREDLDFVFRAVHSLKGGSAYFHLIETTRTSHLLENLLDRARNGAFTFDEELYRICLSYIDVQRDVLGRVKIALGKGSSLAVSAGSSDLLSRIERYHSMVEKGQMKSEAVSTSEATTPAQEPATVTQVTPAPVSVTPLVAPVPSKSPSPAEKSDKVETKPREGSELKNFVKVDTQRLDFLIEYIGEMVISSSMLIQTARNLLAENETVVNNCHQLESLTRDIQEIGMSMRLVPIKGLFQKMGRLVWDTGKKIGKDINFRVDGEDTELDRTVIERIADPLMHMVRNSVDHGIEPPEERLRAGKPRAGTVELSAYHSGGSVFVRIQDDGRGLNQDAIVKKALEKGIVSPEQRLTEHEIFQLIFAPGFSTAAVVTDISGRGVGMDVVKRNIEEMRGRILIKSIPGQGSTFTVELPLTLAILDGIEAVVGGERLIIPALNVIEFIKPTSDMLTETLDRGETLRFRGDFLPIFRIGTLFGIESQRTQLDECILMVVDGNGERVALVVDDVVGKLPAVIKSLGSVFRHVQGVAGCAVMPDGGVALIVDVSTFVQAARSERKGFGYSAREEIHIH